MVGLLGPMVDVPVVTVLVIYKAPIMLFKGWQRLLRDLIGREGPFLETVCVPFAGISILLWPIAVALATLAGITSGFPLGCYAAAVAYQVYICLMLEIKSNNFHTFKKMSIFF